jgi:DNA-binding transcriptional ArsR family regulator
MPRSARSALARPASIFAALGDKTRLRLVLRLSNDGPMSITQLAAGFAITRQAVTKHLRVMEGAGLVRRRRHGRESRWQLDQDRLAEARRHLETISAHWDQTLERLKHLVEE